MHAEYLHSLFLHNDLFEGHYQVDDRPVTLGDIRVPIFAVGTVRDHVAPWRSVYKISLLTDTDVTFLLTSGGHNAGIVSEPGHPHRSYHVSTRLADEFYIDPDTWQAAMPAQEGRGGDLAGLAGEAFERARGATAYRCANVRLPAAR